MTTETKIDTGTDELLCVIRDRVAIITLNRPEARNAMSDNLTPALRAMIKACGENPDVGALLLTALAVAGSQVPGIELGTAVVRAIAANSSTFRLAAPTRQPSMSSLTAAVL